jgi:hypothetical protein
LTRAKIRQRLTERGILLCTTEGEGEHPAADA